MQVPHRSGSNASIGDNAMGTLELPPGLEWYYWCGEPAVKRGNSNVGFLTETTNDKWGIAIWRNGDWEEIPGNHSFEEAKHILTVMLWTI